jgi:hypothetical protein
MPKKTSTFSTFTLTLIFISSFCVPVMCIENSGFGFISMFGGRYDNLYGPNYKSDADNRGPSFFAAGPIAGIHAGFSIKNKNGQIKNYAGIKPFFAILSSKDNGTGIVAGAAFEYGRIF